MWADCDVVVLDDRGNVSADQISLPLPGLVRPLKLLDDVRQALRVTLSWRKSVRHVGKSRGPITIHVRHKKARVVRPAMHKSGREDVGSLPSSSGVWYVVSAVQCNDQTLLCIQ
jgi:hypothetical protein